MQLIISTVSFYEYTFPSLKLVNLLFVSLSIYQMEDGISRINAKSMVQAYDSIHVLYVQSYVC